MLHRPAGGEVRERVEGRLVLRTWLRRPILKFTLLVVLAALSATARSKPEMAPDDISLAGQLLVASSDIGDPRFDRAVVLLVRHNKHGALGIVINRPVGEQPLASVLAAVGEEAAGVEGRVLLFAGGPVELETGFVLHSADYHRPATVDIDGHLAMTSTPEILSDIAHHKGPAKILIAFGYSGWGPGQLESELAQHGWFTAPADPKLIFDEDREKVWQEAMARRTRPL
jgi:putative transcriptional regulator